jgi:hypothetical protein
MATVAKGVNKIAVALHDWSEDDRQDAIDFAIHPGNGTSSVALYLNHRGVKASLDTVHRWKKSLITESQKINLIRQLTKDYRGLEPSEILSFVAAAMAEALVNFQKKISSNESISSADVQALTSLAKEARSAAGMLASYSPQSTSSMKELELGFALSFSNKIEGIFENDETILERVKNACRAILVEIEGQYQ